MKMIYCARQSFMRSLGKFLFIIFAPLSLYGMISESKHTLGEYELSPEDRLAKQRKCHKKTSPILMRKTAIYNLYKKKITQEIIALSKRYNEALELYNPAHRRLKFYYNTATKLTSNLSIKDPDKISMAKKAVDIFLQECKKASPPAPLIFPILDLALSSDDELSDDDNENCWYFRIPNEDQKGAVDADTTEEREDALLNDSDND